MACSSSGAPDDSFEITQATGGGDDPIPLPPRNPKSKDLFMTVELAGKRAIAVVKDLGLFCATEESAARLHTMVKDKSLEDGVLNCLNDPSVMEWDGIEGARPSVNGKPDWYFTAPSAPEGKAFGLTNRVKVVDNQFLAPYLVDAQFYFVFDLRAPACQGEDLSTYERINPSNDEAEQLDAFTHRTIEYLRNYDRIDSRIRRCLEAPIKSLVPKLFCFVATVETTVVKD